jgi:hypothetical protein
MNPWEALTASVVAICITTLFVVGFCDSGWPSFITINKYYNSDEED